jgi:hypothetical protein
MKFYRFGHDFTRISDIEYEWYRFASNGIVLAQFGMKNGAITTPAFYWKITDGHILVMTDTPEGRHNMTISYEFRSLTDKYAVTMDGKQFKRE